jgi:ferredoxin
VERETCIGTQQCERRAPHTFALDERRKAVVRDPPGDPLETILEAANGCPAFAIRVVRGDETLT